MPIEVIDSVGSLLEALHKYPLLARSQLAELSGDRGRLGQDPRALARILVQRGWLTPYQINLLLQGRGAELLLEPYLVLSRLGEGGSGLVLKARHRRMKRVVAIKLIRKSLLTDADVVARFAREMEVASQVSHPNVVHAYDAGPIGGTLALVMEYVDGTELNQLVKERWPTAPGPGLRLHPPGGTRHAARPREGAGPSRHQAIEPAGDDAEGGRIRTGRYGQGPRPGPGPAAARTRPDAASASQLTTMGSVMMGTPDYMAPEQALDLRRHRHPGRHLQPGLHALFPADRTAAVPGRHAGAEVDEAPGGPDPVDSLCAARTAGGTRSPFPADVGQGARRPLSNPCRGSECPGAFCRGSPMHRHPDCSDHVDRRFRPPVAHRDGRGGSGQACAVVPAALDPASGRGRAAVDRRCHRLVAGVRRLEGERS